MNDKRYVTLLGQTPPPWHGQAVATQILFDHNWPGYDVDRIRMDYSVEMEEVGRFQIKKLFRLFNLIIRTRRSLSRSPDTILLYPPASAKWVPFLRDVLFLACVRGRAARTVFIFHASGLAEFTEGSSIRSWLAELAYHGADMALEVAEETNSPHRIYGAKRHLWCPCGIDVPNLPRRQREDGKPISVLFVGSLQEGKGVLEILKTAAILRDRGNGGNFRFAIVGRWMDADFKREMLDLHSMLDLEGIVEFPGQLTGADKWGAYQDADVFLFPSHYPSEASPIVLMEALGAGLPVISTIWNGIPALMHGCETATLLPIKSPVAYADALLGLYQRKAELEFVATKSLRFYQDHFRPERFVERVEDAFLKVSGQPATGEEPSSEEPIVFEPLSVSVYLADQNPGHDRSLGISRMSQIVLKALQDTGECEISSITSKSSQKSPAGSGMERLLPWGTRPKWIRLLTDHLHPMFMGGKDKFDIHYFPKGYLPFLSSRCRPSVVTIHDTIIQYDEDHYPNWRNFLEYGYWALLLKHTLRKADAILTVSQSAKGQIEAFMLRHGIPKKLIEVTYEPCLYEGFPQPQSHPKGEYVVHLASCEPHKRTGDLIRWWEEALRDGRKLPVLHLIGKVPPQVNHLVTQSRGIVKRPFLDDHALREAYLGALALILPSEVEGFGLPALEAYYQGTPVCFVRGTSVEEILAGVTEKGGFSLEDPSTLFPALDEVMEMDHREIRLCGLKLREIYASDKVAERMLAAFRRAMCSS